MLSTFGFFFFFFFFLHVGLSKSCASSSIRQYKAKVQEWGMEKYIKAQDMQILLAKRDQRARDRGVRTAFVANDVDLEEDRINLFGKRRSGKSGDYVSPSTSMYSIVARLARLDCLTYQQPHLRASTITHRCPSLTPNPLTSRRTMSSSYKTSIIIAK